jgi:hypothetical protein
MDLEKSCRKAADAPTRIAGLPGSEVGDNTFLFPIAVTGWFGTGLAAFFGGQRRFEAGQMAAFFGLSQRPFGSVGEARPDNAGRRFCHDFSMP